jgi:hypothetical protein
MNKFSQAGKLERRLLLAIKPLLNGLAGRFLIFIPITQE